MNEFFICDLRDDWRKHRYITFWRPNNANYAWPLSWAGRYTQAVVDEGGSYYCMLNGEKVRFPVPCAAAELLAEPPRPGDIDGNTGPVVRHTKRNREILRAAMYRPNFQSRRQP